MGNIRCIGIEVSLGRNSLVGTTIKSPDKLPQHLSADEKHAHLAGNKIYIASTVGNGCILGVDIAENADQVDLEASYGTFKSEAQDIGPHYSPKTVNTDGWKATVKAWKKLFHLITVISCLLHIFISIRDRASKKFKDFFRQVSQKLWECYRAENKASFSQKVRRLNEWCQKKS